MNIKILFLKSTTVLMGEVIESDDIVWIKNPIQILTKESEQEGKPAFSIAFSPVLQYTIEASNQGISIPKTEILSYLTPVDQLYSHYFNFFAKNE